VNAIKASHTAVGNGDAFSNASAAKSLSGDQVVKQTFSLITIATELLGDKGRKVFQYAFFTAARNAALGQLLSEYVLDFHGRI
jgi:hypothetical protein